MAFEDLVERGAQLAREAQEEERELLKQRDEIDAQLKYVRTFIRRLGVNDAAVRATKKKADNKSIAAETLVRVAKACLVLAEERDSFTVGDIADALDVHDSTVRFAFASLRDQEFLRKLPGRIERREHFTILDAHVLDLLTAAASENGRATA